jgi:uncharacterized membrane protein YdbT with pleckstrin-like domain
VAYPDDLLAEDERVVIHKHPHWKMLVRPVIVFLLIVAGCGYLAALLRNTAWHKTGWIALAAVGAVMVIWFSVAPLVRWRTTHFVITTQRVMVREGVFTRTGIDIPMSRINSVQFRHGFINQLFGCGTLIVESASDEPLEFDDIPQVERVHSLLYREVNDDPHDDFHPGRGRRPRNEAR